MANTIMQFINDSIRVKGERDYLPLFVKYQELFIEQGWNVPDVDTLRAKLGDLRVAATASVMRSRVETGELAPGSRPTVWKGEKAPKGDASGYPWTAVMFDAKGNVATYLAEETDKKTGKTVKVEREYRKGFAMFHKAEEWLQRTLLEKGGPGYAGEVRTTLTQEIARSLESRYERDSLDSNATWGVRGANATALHIRKMKAPPRGKWMADPGTSRAKFSRG